MTPLVFLASIPIALFVDSTAAKWSWVALLVVVSFTGRLIERAESRPRR
ncbi:MAG TPA: hypothetical protein VFN24_01415 [Microbacterium sp.]|nr:hypothetical protein [Microbacterium sp.]